MCSGKDQIEEESIGRPCCQSLPMHNMSIVLFIHSADATAAAVAANTATIKLQEKIKKISFVFDMFAL